ncbi:enterobactin/ferric enterobactin esterase [Gimesia aquarii]|uniref:Enterobactin/ferric enterobactin esterase n=2 Tax=Gimesia aquarii TaxID=2527964 RepID=A0A517VWF8_9PLAN|nr:enterobactin/ferric enterobactin esterase [Gimesia aquarii]
MPFFQHASLFSFLKDKGMNFLTAVCFLCLNLVYCDVSFADWPQLRGEKCDGHAEESSILSRTSDVQLKIGWKKALGSGYSSVVVAGDRIVTGYCDDKEGYLVCFSAEDGRELWKHQTGPRWKGSNGSFDGPIATPAVGFGRVFMITPAGDLFAVKLKSGELDWKINVAEKLGIKPIFYGFGASPIIHGKHLFIQLGPPAGTLCALNPTDGEVVWSQGTDSVGYQNPVPIVFNGKTVLLSAGNTQIAGVDTQSGKALFEFTHQGQGARGAWSLIPVPMPGNLVFLAHDDTRSKLIALKTGNQTKPIDVEEVWEERSIRNSYNVPVAVGENIFAFSSRILTCVDDKGKLLWRSRKPGDGFISAVDNHLILLTKAGTMHIARASVSGYEEITQEKIFDDVTWSLPAIHKNSIFVRSIGEIARVNIVPGKTSPQRLVKSEPVGEKFQAFLDRVENAKATDKNKEVDQFLAKTSSTPYIENGIVHFLLRGNYQDAAVASDLFGARQERRMQSVKGTDLFYFAAKIPNDTRVSYVFIADYKTILDPLNPRKNKSSLFVEDIEIVHLVGGETLTMSWFDMPGRPKSIEPDSSQALVGQLSTTHLVSKNMKDEKIPLTVYTPPQYPLSGKSYPVVFVHDGEAAIKLGKLPHIVEKLIQSKTIPEVVVVFIHRPFNPMLGAFGYEQMFGTELIPMIEQKYQISKKRKDHSSLGGGFSGLIALTSAMSNRDQIGRLAIQSVHAFELHQLMIDGALATAGPKSDILMQWGKFEVTNPEENWDMAKTSDRISKQLSKSGHNIQAQVVNDGSDWICWRSHAAEVFKFLLSESK